MRIGIDNIPNDEHLKKLQVIDEIAQPLRDHFSENVRINSGYRSPHWWYNWWFKEIST